MINFKKKAAKTIIRIFIKIHNYSYEKISAYATILEEGLHPKHRLMKYYEFFLDNIKESDWVLDIGCGNGFVAGELAKKACSLTGIDISKKNIETALKKYKADNLDFIEGDATSYDFKTKFDVAVLSNVLEHIEDRVSFLKKISDTAKKLLIRVPTIERGWLDLYKKELGLEYRLDKSHYTEHTKQDFINEIEASALKIDNMANNFGEIWAVVSKK